MVSFKEFLAAESYQKTRGSSVLRRILMQRRISEISVLVSLMETFTKHMGPMKADISTTYYLRMNVGVYCLTHLLLDNSEEYLRSPGPKDLMDMEEKLQKKYPRGSLLWRSLGNKPTNTAIENWVCFMNHIASEPAYQTYGFLGTLIVCREPHVSRRRNLCRPNR